MTDFRALCAELNAAFNTYAVDESHHDLLVRARTALAQPEPQGPSDTASRVVHYLEQRRLIRGLDPDVIHALHSGTDEPRQASLTVSDLEALTRWGRSAIEPVVELTVQDCADMDKPEPQGPTDEELDEFAIYWWGSETDERSVSDVIECGSMAAYARAVLARWGRPAIETVLEACNG